MIRLSGFRGPMYILVIAAIIGSATGSVCAFVFSASSPGNGAGLILYAGVLVAGLLGGYIGYHSADGSSLPAKIGVGVVYAGLEAVLVAFLSLLIFVNTRGE